MRDPDLKALQKRIGRTMRAARKAKGLTVHGAASGSGVHPATIWRLEGGAFTPRVETLWRLCQIYDLSIEQVFKDKRP